MTAAKPFIKWAGGKRQAIPQMGSLFPERFDRYYEPFLGGGAVFFALQPKNAVLSDLNPQLVNLWICVRDHVLTLIDLLQDHRKHHDLDGQNYFERQKMLLKVGGAIEMAARFIYLNKACFNGLYRENSRGEFNVSYDSRPRKQQNICDLENLLAASEALQGVEIRCMDFERVYGLAQPGDFVYFDPPYGAVSETAKFTRYTKENFSVDDQIRLRNLAKKLSYRSVSWLMSNSDTPFIRSLYEGFQIATISVARPINSDVKKRGKVNELVIWHEKK